MSFRLEYFGNWNVEAPELCKKDSLERQESIKKKILTWLEEDTVRRIFCFTEWNLHDDEFYKKVEEANFRVFFVTKGGHSSPPTSGNPDGVLVLIPISYLESGYEVQVMPRAVVGKAGAPWLKLTHTESGNYWIFTHLKSKLTTKESATRLCQFELMIKMSVGSEEFDTKYRTLKEYIDSPECLLQGVIGDLNESPAPATETGEKQFETYLLDLFKGWMYDTPFTNMKTSEDLKGKIYEGDQRKTDESGMCLSTTDWILTRNSDGAGEYWIEGRDPSLVSTPEEWYHWYLSDHRPVFCNL